jgi:hypothetical protein
VIIVREQTEPSREVPTRSNAAPLPIAATMADAVVALIPGMVVSNRASLVLLGGVGEIGVEGCDPRSPTKSSDLVQVLGMVSELP